MIQESLQAEGKGCQRKTQIFGKELKNIRNSKYLSKYKDYSFILIMRNDNTDK